MKLAPALFLSAAAALLLTSCGESMSEVAARHKDGLDSLRADLKKLGELIPEKPEFKELAAPLDPAPVFKGDAELSDTSIIIWDALADPAAELDSEIMNLYLSNGLETIFVWASQEGDAFESFEPDLKTAIALRYLVAYRFIKYNPPVVTPDLNYTVGSASMGVYVFDRKSQEIACSFPVVALSSPTINYSYKPNENKANAAQRWARSDLWTNLRKQTLKSLAEKTSGTFED